MTPILELRNVRKAYGDFVAVDSVSEEGNEVGKFMDIYRPPASCPDGGSPSA